ncbi:MAG: hypothetical protein ABJC79_17270, partial [Acidimicrobiia bacterium]
MGQDSEEPTPIASLDDVVTTSGRRRRRATAIASVVAVIAAAGGAVALASGRDDSSSSQPRRRVLTTPAARAVLSALDASTSAGGYEVAFDFVIQPAGEPDSGCHQSTSAFHGGGSSSATTVGGGGGSTASTACHASTQPVTVSGHGTVSLDPYFLQTTSTVSGLGEVTVRTDGTKIAEQGGANYGGSLEDGQPLSGFASAVESTFGPGPGALTMLGLASPTGYLSLSASAVTGVRAVGTGVVGDTPVTFYDVISDSAAMRQLPALTDEQLKTVDEALKVLDRSGFVEAKSRIAVDADGYIRESTSTASFSDGTRMTRHMTLSRFGCTGTGPTPANPAGAAAPATGDCVTPTTTTSTT